MRMGEIRIIRIRDRKIILETRAQILTGSIMDQLEALLNPYGYIKINQHEIVKTDKIKNIIIEERRVILGDNERMQCIVSRRNWYKILNSIQNVEK